MKVLAGLNAGILCSGMMIVVLLEILRAVFWALLFTMKLPKPLRYTLLPLAKELNCDFIWVHAAATVLESTLAWSLNRIGVPCLVIEAGVGMRITQEYGERITVGLLRLMKRLGIWSGPVSEVVEPIVSTDGRVKFINADYPGVFIPKVRHWMNLHEGDSLGMITDPIDGTVLQEVKSPCNGLVFTLREYPVVNPGSLVARVLAVSEPGKDKKGAAK